MRENRKIERRSFLRYMTGACALLVCKPLSIFERMDHAGIDPMELLARLHRQVRRDFELGRTVEVDGWILSITEARLSALVSLSDPGSVSRCPSDRRR